MRSHNHPTNIPQSIRLKLSIAVPAAHLGSSQLEVLYQAESLGAMQSLL